MQSKNTSAYAAEAVGTFVLVLAIALAVTGTKVIGSTDFVLIGFVHALALSMLIATLGGVSGAHFNPAVTITLATLKKISAADAAIYIVMQVIGAVLAALVVRGLLSDNAKAVHEGAAGVSTALKHSGGRGFLAEGIGAFFLMFAIMGTAVNERAHASWAPWIIGGTLGFGVMVLGPLTGAALNPARAFGPALVGNAFDGGGRFLLAFVLGPIAGALVAGWGYKVIALDARGVGAERPVDTLPE